MSLGILGGLMAAMSYKFTIHINQKGEHYFVFHNAHGNVEPICWSEGYSSRQACIDAINKVRNGAASADIE